MSSSRENEMLPELRPAMDADLFKAAIKGNSNVLTQRLGLSLGELTKIQVTIEASDIDTQNLKPEHQINQSDLRSVTDFGDTLLHLLITERHNELALVVFTYDMSLLTAQNNKFETPLHCAAKFGNEDIICALAQLAYDVIRNALGVKNENGDTALHVAANRNHGGVVSKLMMLDPQVAYKKNKQGFTPLYIATAEGYTELVLAMLATDVSLSGIQFFDGTFPVHLAARLGNTKLVEHFLQNYPDDSTLLDRRGRNLFHMAAEEENAEVLTRVFALAENNSPQISQMVKSMINAPDYERNTPLHIAAMKGHKSVMRKIWDKLNQERETLLRNHEGQTAFEVSYDQLRNTNKDIGFRIDDYIKNKGWYFTPEWFDLMEARAPLSNKLEKIQSIGIGSVLITTVAFAAAFTVPGGYNADNGTPILGRRYMFRAFALANALAFVQSSACILTIVLNAINDNDIHLDLFILAKMLFFMAANCMTLAFGLGSYVMLAPISLPIAIIILVIALVVSSPAQRPLFWATRNLCKWIASRWSIWHYLAVMLAAYVFPYLFIFCLAFL